MTSRDSVGAVDDAGGELRAKGGRAAFILGSSQILHLAAAPTFAIMALLTAAAGDGASDILCATAQNASPLTGMVAMYVLMSVFHAPPWLKILSRSRASG